MKREQEWSGDTRHGKDEKQLTAAESEEPL